MGGRYWIKGVQLGMLQESSKADREKLINEIIDKQFIGKKRDLNALLKKSKK